MEKFKVLNANIPEEYQQWLDIWESWDGKEVFAHPGYVSLYKKQSEPYCAILNLSESSILFPFCLRPIDKALSDECFYDIITPYGFGDIYVIGDGLPEKWLKLFYKKFNAWARQYKVISGFIRFNLFSRSIRFYDGDVEYNNYNIVCNLKKGEPILWEEYKLKVRRAVRKALRSGLIIEKDHTGERLDSFLNLYHSTMLRLNADQKYLISRSYFENLHQLPKGTYTYFYVKKGEKDIAAILVLISDNSLYYFLGGSDKEYLRFRPNELLHHEIIKWGIKMKKRHYILGGGFSKDDSLFHFKKGFSPDGIRPFFIGKKIYNAELYQSLVQKRNELTNDLVGMENEFFPQYRIAKEFYLI
ncbi:GNAT family N-acetyltransferase [Carboxylicivirga marina]|uniref:GNAT family N-acetyltransferase n=1 Tax=Carboxylicivirga marina TaxID=2800988 RepID=UPI0025996379|nr:GNAT family N-acetyltransferase [uncultured Carboxylicivirga sp.]